MKRILIITIAIILILGSLTLWLILSRSHKNTSLNTSPAINSVKTNPASFSQAQQTLSQFEANKPLNKAQLAAQAFINIKNDSDCTTSIKELSYAGTLIDLRIAAAQLQDPVASDLAQDMIVLEQDIISACNSHQLRSIGQDQTTLKTDLNYLSVRLNQDRSQ